mmetsp:Transcript_30858/g.78080  ORF Transcript_30858/g.78080 Transcript_30858/m.78080 type:complete len:145 (-) Transcript_30858:178-612(-)
MRWLTKTLQACCQVVASVAAQDQHEAIVGCQVGCACGGSLKVLDQWVERLPEKGIVSPGKCFCNINIKTALGARSLALVTACRGPQPRQSPPLGRRLCWTRLGQLGLGDPENASLLHSASALPLAWALAPHTPDMPKWPVPAPL